MRNIDQSLMNYRKCRIEESYSLKLSLISDMLSEKISNQTEKGWEIITSKVPGFGKGYG